MHSPGFKQRFMVAFPISIFIFILVHFHICFLFLDFSINFLVGFLFSLVATVLLLAVPWRPCHGCCKDTPVAGGADPCADGGGIEQWAQTERMPAYPLFLQDWQGSEEDFLTSDLLARQYLRVLQSRPLPR